MPHCLSRSCKKLSLQIVNNKGKIMKFLYAGFAGLLLSTALTSAFAADTYPSKPITLVFPYASGSAADTMTRLLASAMSKQLGQQVIVDSKPGAGGSIATEHVVRSAPDGHTLLLSASGTIAVNPHIYKLRYNPVEDLEQISIAVEVPFVFIVGKNFAAQDYSSFKKLSKTTPDGLTSANAGLGTQAHLTQAAFSKLADVDLNIVGYKGASPAINDILGGHVDSMMDNAASQVPYVQSGKTTALFVTSNYRFEPYPDVPTAKELGIEGLVPAGWFGLAAPKGTPSGTIDKVYAALQASLNDPEISQKLKEMGWVSVGSSPKETLKRARNDYTQLGDVVRDIGLQPN